MCIRDSPYNSYAWYYQAVCHYWIRSELESELESKQQSSATAEELDNLRLRISEAEERAIKAFGQSSKFFRHRRRSLVNMAIIHAARSEWEPALKHLETYVSEGNLLNRSLEYITALGVGGRDKVNQDPEANPRARLHSLPEFWKLVDKENRLRGVSDSSQPAYINRSGRH
jgi:hypothetical protein